MTTRPAIRPSLLAAVSALLALAAVALHLGGTPRIGEGQPLEQSRDRGSSAGENAHMPEPATPVVVTVGSGRVSTGDPGLAAGKPTGSQPAARLGSIAELGSGANRATGMALATGQPGRSQQPAIDPVSRSPADARAGSAQLPDGGELKPWYCFAPETPPAVITRFTGNPHAHQGRLVGTPATGGGEVSAAAFQLGNRWTRTAVNGSLSNRQGEPVTVTWSLLPDGTFIGATNDFESSDPSDLSSTLRRIYGSQSNWLPIFQRVFDRWAEVSGVRFVYEPNDDGASFPSSPGISGVRGDIRIGGHRVDGISGLLAYNWSPNRGDMVIDTADDFSSTANASRKLRNILAHEIGHGLGLQHVCPPSGTKLMEPWLSIAFDGPQHDDILSAQRHYGDAYEDTISDRFADDNDTFATASDLGELPVGRTSIDLLSIDDSTDADFFKFTKQGPMEISVTAAPVGLSYLEGGQAAGGTCSGGFPFDSRQIHDLGLAVYDSGGTVLITSNASAAGANETLTGFRLPPGPGPFAIRVIGDAADQIQLYQLAITLRRTTPDTLITVADATGLESRGTIDLTASLDSPKALPVSFDYRVAGVSATEGEDFAATAGTVTIPPGELTATFSIQLIDDLLDEPDELVRVHLSNPVNADLAYAVVVGTIIDDDQTRLSIGSLQLSETAGRLEIPITLSTPSQQTVTVTLNTISRSATAGRDFAPLPSTIQLRPGQIYALARSSVIDDSEFEMTEDFIVQLINPINAGIATGTGLVTIFDDDVFARLADSLEFSSDPASGELVIGWRAVPGHDYTILFSDDLLRWQILPGAGSITARAWRETYHFTPAAGGRRYYRMAEGYTP